MTDHESAKITVLRCRAVDLISRIDDELPTNNEKIDRDLRAMREGVLRIVDKLKNRTCGAVSSEEKELDEIHVIFTRTMTERIHHGDVFVKEVECRTLEEVIAFGIEKHHADRIRIFENRIWFICADGVVDSDRISDEEMVSLIMDAHRNTVYMIDGKTIKTGFDHFESAEAWIENS